MFRIVLKLFMYMALLILIFFLGLGHYLELRGELVRADAIVVISGGGEERIEHGIQLYKDEWAEKMILAGAARDDKGPSNAAIMANRAIKAGVSSEAIILDEDSQNTYQNAVNVGKILQVSGLKSIILVTSSYHQRRAYQTFHRVLGDEIEIINSPAPVSFWRASNWWGDPKARSLALQEIAKIIYSAISGNYA